MKGNGTEHIVHYLTSEEKQRHTHSHQDVSHPLLVVSQKSLLMSCLEHYNLRKGKETVLCEE